MVGIELRRLWVRNFKSLRDFSLDVSTRLNVVIGTNGSGKTALVEVFELWRDLVDYARDASSIHFSSGGVTAAWCGATTRPYP